MSDTTKIGWTDKTWNPWMGCARVSTGCDRCYMFVDQRRYGQDPKTLRRSKTTFRKPLSKSWSDPAMVFTCSWSDWFIAGADEWRAEAWDIVRQTPHLTYQILTKRHGRIAKHLPPGWPYHNVWLGITGEDHEWFHRRAASLRDVPGDFVRMVSAEPLVARIRVTAKQLRDYKINWVIVGGESQAGCRSMPLDWVREIRDACAGAGVAFYLKQLGGHPDKRAHAEAAIDGAIWTEYPRKLRVPDEEKSE